MSASYPQTVKNFLQLQDGVDKVLAAHPNDRGDEITAIETMLGAIGSTQAYSESFKNLLLGYRRGCAADYKSASDLYVRAGEIAIPDASNNVRLRRNPSDTTVTWSDIDTGAEESSTVYYVYAVADASGSTFTVKISKSSSAPSGATFYKKIGSFYNDGSSNIINVNNIADISGSSKTVSVTVSTTGSLAITGIGFKPSSIIFVAQGLDGSVNAAFAVGVCDSALGIMSGSVGRDPGNAVVTSYSTTSMRCLGGVTFSAFTVSSLDSDGFTINRSTGIAGATCQAICIK